MVVNKVNAVLADARKEGKKNRIKKLPPNELSTDEVSLLGVLANILRPFAALTDVWQGDGVTSSFVLVGLIQALDGKPSSLFILSA